MYRVADAVLVRAATHRAGMDLPDWPDLTGSTSRHVAEWRGWLEQIWSLDTLGEAIEVASPVLASQARKAIDGHDLKPRQVRRVVISVARYVLRDRQGHPVRAVRRDHTGRVRRPGDGAMGRYSPG
jgi:lantibiotic biosynthesis protein